MVVAISFNYLYKDILQTFLSGINQNIYPVSLDGQNVIQVAQMIKVKNFFRFFGIALLVTLIFSYIIAKMTLSPVRNALKSQKRFVSDIAHELRTPLAIIKTNSEVAMLDKYIDNKIKKVFKNNIEELDRASGIINNLLTFSNLIRPEYIKFDQIDMSLVVDTAVKKLDELIKRRETKVTVKKISPYHVWGNMTALEQIVNNLLKNAINYTPFHGKVLVKVEPDYIGNVVLTVSDTGIGIAEKDLAHIFEPFYRAEESRNRQSGSSGLGLTIVSELVKLHSGRVEIVSKLKEGTIVRVILPHGKRNLPHVVNGSTEESNKVALDFLKDK